MKLKIGIQLYTVREHANANPAETLKKIAELGYEGVQFAGYYSYKADELKTLLDSLGLKAAGTHVDIRLLEENTEAQLEYADLLGLRTITIPHLEIASLLLEQTIEKIEKLREAAGKHGIEILFHNHHPEFETENGSLKLDTFFSRLPGVFMELDTYWATFAGVNPVEYMEKNRQRLKFIHIKDMNTNPDLRLINANIGEGCLDIGSYLKKAADCNVEWAFVEMDKCDGDELECIRISRENLISMGF